MGSSLFLASREGKEGGGGRGLPQLICDWADLQSYKDIGRFNWVKGTVTWELDFCT